MPVDYEMSDPSGLLEIDHIRTEIENRLNEEEPHGGTENSEAAYDKKVEQLQKYVEFVEEFIKFLKRRKTSDVGLQRSILRMMKDNYYYLTKRKRTTLPELNRQSGLMIQIHNKSKKNPSLSKFCVQNDLDGKGPLKISDEIIDISSDNDSETELIKPSNISVNLNGTQEETSTEVIKSGESTPKNTENDAKAHNDIEGSRKIEASTSKDNGTGVQKKRNESESEKWKNSLKTYETKNRDKKEKVVENREKLNEDQNKDECRRIEKLLENDELNRTEKSKSIDTIAIKPTGTDELLKSNTEKNLDNSEISKNREECKDKNLDDKQDAIETTSNIEKSKNLNTSQNTKINSKSSINFRKVDYASDISDECMENECVEDRKNGKENYKDDYLSDISETESVEYYTSSSYKERHHSNEEDPDHDEYDNVIQNKKKHRHKCCKHKHKKRDRKSHRAPKSCKTDEIDHDDSSTNSKYRPLSSSSDLHSQRRSVENSEIIIKEVKSLSFEKIKEIDSTPKSLDSEIVIDRQYKKKFHDNHNVYEESCSSSRSFSKRIDHDDDSNDRNPVVLENLESNSKSMKFSNNRKIEKFIKFSKLSLSPKSYKEGTKNEKSTNPKTNKEEEKNGKTTNSKLHKPEQKKEKATNPQLNKEEENNDKHTNLKSDKEEQKKEKTINPQSSKEEHEKEKTTNPQSNKDEEKSDKTIIPKSVKELEIRRKLSKVHLDDLPDDSNTSNRDKLPIRNAIDYSDLCMDEHETRSSFDPLVKHGQEQRIATPDLNDANSRPASTASKSDDQTYIPVFIAVESSEDEDDNNDCDANKDDGDVNKNGDDNKDGDDSSKKQTELTDEIPTIHTINICSDDDDDDNWSYPEMNNKVATLNNTIIDVDDDDDEIETSVVKTNTSPNIPNENISSDTIPKNNDNKPLGDIENLLHKINDSRPENLNSKETDSSKNRALSVSSPLNVIVKENNSSTTTENLKKEDNNNISGENILFSRRPKANQNSTSTTSSASSHSPDLIENDLPNNNPTCKLENAADLESKDLTELKEIAFKLEQDLGITRIQDLLPPIEIDNNSQELYAAVNHDHDICDKGDTSNGFNPRDGTLSLHINQCSSIPPQKQIYFPEHLPSFSQNGHLANVNYQNQIQSQSFIASPASQLAAIQMGNNEFSNVSTFPNTTNIPAARPNDPRFCNRLTLMRNTGSSSKGPAYTTEQPNTQPLDVPSTSSQSTEPLIQALKEPQTYAEHKRRKAEQLARLAEKNKIWSSNHNITSGSAEEKKKSEPIKKVIHDNDVRKSPLTVSSVSGQDREKDKTLTSELEKKKVPVRKISRSRSSSRDKNELKVTNGRASISKSRNITRSGSNSPAKEDDKVWIIDEDSIQSGKSEKTADKISEDDSKGKSNTLKVRKKRVIYSDSEDSGGESKKTSSKEIINQTQPEIESNSKIQDPVTAAENNPSSASSNVQNGLAGSLQNIQDLLMNLILSGGQDAILKMIQASTNISAAKFEKIRDIITKKPEKEDDSINQNQAENNTVGKDNEEDKTSLKQTAEPEKQKQIQVKKMSPSTSGKKKPSPLKQSKRGRKRKTEVDKLNQDINSCHIRDGVLLANGLRKTTATILEKITDTATITQKTTPTTPKTSNSPKKKSKQLNQSLSRKLSLSQNIYNSSDDDEDGDFQPTLHHLKSVNELQERQRAEDSIAAVRAQINKHQNDTDDDDDDGELTDEFENYIQRKKIKINEVNNSHMSLMIRKELRVCLRRLSPKTIEKCQRRHDVDESPSVSDSDCDTETNSVDLLRPLKSKPFVEKNRRGRGRKPKAYPKNTDKTQHCRSKLVEKCTICCKKRVNIVQHYVNDHENMEVFVARLPNHDIDRLERKPMTVKRKPYSSQDKSKPGYSAKCIFCKKRFNNRLKNWYEHFTEHTGEYSYECTECGERKVSMSQLIHYCGSDKKKGYRVSKVYRFDLGVPKILAYRCWFCNYVQLHKANVIKHLTVEHELTLLDSERNVREFVLFKIPDKKPVQIANEPIIIQSVRSLQSTDIGEDDDDDDDNKTVDWTNENESTLSAMSPLDFYTNVKDEFQDDSTTVQSSAFMTVVHNQKVIPKIKKSANAMSQDILDILISSDDIEMKPDISLLDPEKQNEEKNQSDIQAEDIKPDLSLLKDLTGTEELQKENETTDKENRDPTTTTTTPTLTPTNSNTAKTTSSQTNSSSRLNDLITMLQNTFSADYNSSSQSNQDENIIPKKSSNTKDSSTTKKDVEQKTKENPQKNVSSSEEPKPKESQNDVTDDIKPNIPTIPEIIPEQSIERNSSPIDNLTPIESSTNVAVPSPNTSRTSTPTAEIKDLPICDNQIQTIGYNILRNNKIKYICLRRDCRFTTIDGARIFHTHIVKHKKSWDGVCISCDNKVVVKRPGKMDEYDHMIKYHLSKIGKRDALANMIPTVQSELVPSSSSTSSCSSSSPSPTTKTTPWNVLNVIKILKPWLNNSLSRKSEIVCTKFLTEDNLCSFYKCMGDDCIFATYSIKKFKRHIAEHDVQKFTETIPNKPWHECCYCDKSFDNSLILSSHINNNHASSIFQCSMCFYRCSSAYGAKIHQNKFHVNNTEQPHLIYICKGRAQTFGSMEQMIIQLRETNVQPFICEICKAPYYAKQPCIDHIRRDHPQYDANILFKLPEYSCVYCPYQVMKEEQIIEHLVDNHPEMHLCACKRTSKEVYTNENSYANVSCTELARFENLVDKKLLKKVVNVLSTDDDDDDDDNDKLQIDDTATTDPDLSNFENVLLDILTTNGEDEENKINQEFSNLIQSSQSNTGYLGKQFRCNNENCFQIFENKETLEDHLDECLTNNNIGGKQYLKQRDWPCKPCNQIFNEYSGIVDHMLHIHNAKVSFKCDFCPFVKNEYKAIKKHIILHHNDKRISVQTLFKSVNETSINRKRVQDDMSNVNLSSSKKSKFSTSLKSMQKSQELTENSSDLEGLCEVLKIQEEISNNETEKVIEEPPKRPCIRLVPLDKLIDPTLIMANLPQIIALPSMSPAHVIEEDINNESLNFFHYNSGDQSSTLKNLLSNPIQLQRTPQNCSNVNQPDLGQSSTASSRIQEINQNQNNSHSVIISPPYSIQPNRRQSVHQNPSSSQNLVNQQNMNQSTILMSDQRNPPVIYNNNISNQQNVNFVNNNQSLLLHQQIPASYSLINQPATTTSAAGHQVNTMRSLSSPSTSQNQQTISSNVGLMSLVIRPPHQTEFHRQQPSQQQQLHQPQKSINQNVNLPNMTAEQTNIVKLLNKIINFVCVSCKESFGAYEDYIQHYRTVCRSKPVHFRLKRKYDCLYCSYSSDHKQLTTHHYQNHRQSTFVLSSREQQHSCSACIKYVGITDDDIIQHSSLEHPNLLTDFPVHLDTINLINIMTQSTLDRLLRIGHPSLAYKCSLCRGIFYNKEDCDKHEKDDAHISTLYTYAEYKNNCLVYGCSQCSYFTDDEKFLINHIKRHIEFFKCNYCSYYNHDESRVISHHKLQHNEINDNLYQLRDKVSIIGIYYKTQLLVFPGGLVITKGEAYKTIYGSTAEAENFISMILKEKQLQLNKKMKLQQIQLQQQQELQKQWIQQQQLQQQQQLELQELKQRQLELELQQQQQVPNQQHAKPTPFLHNILLPVSDTNTGGNNKTRESDFECIEID